MKQSVKYLLISVLSFLLFLAPGYAGAILVYCYYSKNPLSTIFSIVIITISLVIHLIGRALREKIRASREDMKAEQIRKGKGKAYRNMSPKEREKVETMLAIKNEQNLSSTDYKLILKKGSTNPDQDLSSLVGMQQVKEQTLRYKAQIKNKKTYHGSMHMCFLGNPGTGKTTVVSIVTAYLWKYKYIKKNEYISIDGNFLKSAADPIARTTLLLNKAKGKVLFIDEAYSLIQGNKRIGQEILATILNEMENNREDIIVILAGYKKEMKELFNANSGFQSRIKNYLMFEDYSVDELKEIFANLVHKENLVLTAEALEKVESILYRKKRLISFANARTVRNLAEKCITEHDYNVMQHTIDKEDIYRLVKNDIVEDTEIDRYFSE